MKSITWVILGLLALAAGCVTPPPGYRHEVYSYYPWVSDVPPEFYDNDPAMRPWYTMPYWNPNIGGR